MNKKKTRLRLRKQVIISIPIAFVIALVFGLLIVNKNNVLSSMVTKIETQSEKQNEKISITEIELFNNINKSLEIRKKDNTIIYYAQKFDLNVDKVLELAHTFTNNYTSEMYLIDHIIGPQSIKDKMGSFKTEEAGIIYFVRDIYRSPKKYGVELSEIKGELVVDQQKNIVEGKVYLSNGLTYEQYLGKICDEFNIDKELVLAISYLETGYLKSGLFTYSNNVGGQRGYNGWLKYPTLEAGIIGHVISVKAILDNYNIDTTSPTAISDLSSIYVNGHPNNPSDSWTYKVTNIKSKITEKDLFTVE